MDPLVVYSRCSPLLVQYDMLLADYPTLFDACADPSFDLPPSAPAIVISRRGDLTALNLTAGLIWEDIDGARSMRDLAASLVACFQVSEAAARAAVRDCLARLEVRGLIAPGPTIATPRRH